jgi:predicted nucleic acid-binding protein
MKRKFLIDTNFILRPLTNDIPSQVEKSRKILEKIEEKKIIGIISILVINELIWILKRFYKKRGKDYIPEIIKLLSLKNIKILEIKKRELVYILEQMIKTNLDFTDLYLLYFGKELKYKIASFDKKLLKLSF